MESKKYKELYEEIVQEMDIHINEALNLGLSLASLVKDAKLFPIQILVKN